MPRANDIQTPNDLSIFASCTTRRDDIDAVVVSTCEHTHAFATLPALQMGKHVYCEKPLTHSVWEARVIREAAANANVATQMGTQIHAGDNYRRVVELIQTGAIGPVRDVHVWVSRAWGWQGSEEEAKRNGDIVTIQDRPLETHDVPKGLHWDLWLGPAPKRPFHSVYFPGSKVVSLVGLWKRHDVRSRKPLDRLTFLGAEARLSTHRRCRRTGSSPGDRAGVDAGQVRVRRPR